MSFGKNFVWGAATAACQIEGAYREDGKGLNIWDVYSARKENIHEGHTTFNACDHYHNWREDVRIMKEMGLRAYRFSISWSRIMPDGTGQLNPKGIAFYRELIDELLLNGIEPYITLYHWDLPYTLHSQGGWMNPKIVDWFAEYAGIVVRNFSDKVKNFITLNEPQAFIGLGYSLGIHAPGYQVTEKELFMIVHHVLLAHGAAVKIMRQSARGKINIGLAFCGNMYYPVTERREDIEAARAMTFSLPENPHSVGDSIAWFCDPIYLGHYPEEGIKKYGELLPEFTKEDMELIHQPVDFIGQNIYQAMGVYSKEGISHIKEQAVGAPRTAFGWAITPGCMYWVPKFLYERYKIPVYITENGISCCDAVSLDGKIHDPGRIDYMERYLQQLERAVEDGIPIQGYFAWSLLDNFEWKQGYSQRFGLIYIDFTTQQRMWKDSAYWYKNKIEKESQLYILK